MKKRRIGKKSVWTAIITGALLCIGAYTALAGDNEAAGLVSSRLGQVNWSVGTGYFIPYEDELENGLFYKLGLEYTRGNEGLLIEGLFSEVDDSIGLPSDDFQSIITQVAYKRHLEGSLRRLEPGIGLQYQQIDYGYDVKRGKLTAFGLLDYRLTSDVNIRLQASLSEESSTSCPGGCSLGFGGAMIGMDYSF